MEIFSKIEELLDSPVYTDNKIGVQMMETYQRENPPDTTLLDFPHDRKIVVVYWKWDYVPDTELPRVRQKVIATERGTRKELFQCGWNITMPQILHIGIEDE